MSCETLVNRPLNGCSYFQGNTIPEINFEFVGENIDFTDVSVGILIQLFNNNQLVAQYVKGDGITVVDSDNFKIDEVSAVENNFPIGKSTGHLTITNADGDVLTYLKLQYNVISKR
jgi:hypothetical protein